MIDAAKLRRFSQPCKENNLANGSVLFRTVFRVFNELNVGTFLAFLVFLR